MNAFRLLGDLSHLLAMVLMLMNIINTKSVAGLSGKTYMLLALVHITRYMDMFVTFISPYNFMMKGFFIVLSFLTAHMIWGKYRLSYDEKSDTFRVEFVIIPAAGLACLINHDYELYEVMWTFSIYLEAVAIIPQLFMLGVTGEAKTITPHYICFLGCYRAFYLLNWIYRFYTEKYFDLIAVVAGVIQTILFIDFSYLFSTKEDILLGGEDPSGVSTDGEIGASEEDEE